jgi:hypothetical protein
MTSIEWLLLGMVVGMFVTQVYLWTLLHESRRLCDEYRGRLAAAEERPAWDVTFYDQVKEAADSWRVTDQRSATDDRT